jgi:hypothetical protein
MHLENNFGMIENDNDCADYLYFKKRLRASLKEYIRLKKISETFAETSIVHSLSHTKIISHVVVKLFEGSTSQDEILYRNHSSYFYCHNQCDLCKSFE